MRRAHAAANRSAAFTLPEALLALTLSSLAAGVALLALETSMTTAIDAYEQTIAAGLAEQMLDEALGAMYKAKDAPHDESPLGPGAWESQGDGRERFDDSGDFHGFIASGGVDLFGQPLGKDDGKGGLRAAPFAVDSEFFADWRQEFEVYYVSEEAPGIRLPDGQTSGLRAIEARVKRRLRDGSFRTLASRRRVIAHVPHAH